MKKDDKIFLEHVLESINKIEKTKNGLNKDKFENNSDVIDSTLRRLEVIGEAIKNISQELKNKYPEVEWKRIIGTRDILIHAYFSVDMEIIWDIVSNKLPELKRTINKILNELENNKK